MAEPQEVTAEDAPAGKSGGPGDANRGESGAGILFVGDLVGSVGRRTLLECLPILRERHDPTFVIVNGENVAGGLGITPKAARALFAGGVDAITLGNHTYHRREIYPYLDSEPRILRPANFLRIQPGHGTCVLERDGVRLGVINLSGNLYLRAGRSAFTEIEAALGEFGEDIDHILVDMHAEATSEKVALGWMLDGRVSAVVGTHTHIPTADARVLPGGTAYITDVGMTGARGGVIGVKRDQAIESLVTQMPIRFETSEEDPWLMGVLIRCSATRPRSADAIEQVLMARPAPAPRSASPGPG
jgi:metallophosphoesterase (TIGR00282 family)